MDKFSWSVTMLFLLQGPLVRALELASKLEECLQHLLPSPWHSVDACLFGLITFPSLYICSQQKNPRE